MIWIHQSAAQIPCDTLLFHEGMLEMLIYIWGKNKSIVMSANSRSENRYQIKA